MRLPITIWRHTSLELFKLVFITTSILVTAISFVASVRWFADGRLEPLDLMKFMLVAMIPMLAYTLPFAACFGATLTYHRMAQDNEISAAHAGGIGHRGVLMPALIGGVVLAGMLGALNDYIIPKFLRSMESLIADDLTKIMVNSINRGEAVQIGDYIINAEHVIRMNIDPNDPRDAEYVEAGVKEWIVFYKFIGLQFDDDERLRQEVTAREVHLFVFPGDRDDGSTGASIAAFYLVDVVGNGDDGLFFRSASTTFPPIEIPNVLESNPKYLTNFELRALRLDPDSMDWINRKRIDLAYHLGERATTSEINERLGQDDHSFQLRSLRGEILTVHGSAVFWTHEDGWIISPPPGTDRVRVDVTPGPDAELTGTQPISHVARSASFRTNIGDGPRLRELTIDLTLRDATADRNDGRAPDRKELRYTKLELVDSPVVGLLRKSSTELIALAEIRLQGPNPDEFLRNPYNDLTTSIARLDREIVSKYHERIAMSASCLIMVICGAIVAIKLADAQPLIVYLWSFFPALITVITISAGQQITNKTGLYGLGVLWGGVVALCIYSFVTFRSIARH